jgi:hypothetical protein
VSGVVYKYPLHPATPCVVAMPRFAQILHVGSQDDGPVLWALVDQAQEPEGRRFFIYGTGHPIAEEGLRYTGSCQTESGFVWHVFERPLERNIGDLLMEAIGQ